MIKLALVSLLILLTTGLSWAAWTWWPPLISYRIARTDAQTQGLLSRYLDGRQPLEQTAAQLAVLYERKTMLVARLPRTPSPDGRGSLTAITLALPAGVAPEDPRLSPLADRMMMAPPN